MAPSYVPGCGRERIGGDKREPKLPPRLRNPGLIMELNLVVCPPAAHRKSQMVLMGTKRKACRMDW